MLVSEHDSLSLPIVDTSQVGEARRTLVGLAESLGFDETRRGQVALIVTELGNNLVRHATGGELVARSPGAATDEPQGDGVQLEILAIDRGPGMANISSALRDGYSTGGTPGNGLGAVRRLSDEFDFSSTAGVGTVFLSRLRAHAPRAGASNSPPVAQRESFDIGAICLPKPGESVCGDGWWIETDAGSPGRTLMLLADGLGHGLGAADASRMAVRLLRQNPGYELTRLIETMHAAMRSGRGAAVALLEMRSGSDQVQFVGVGNISATILGPQPDVGSLRNLMSHNGTVGAEVRRVQQLTYTLGSDSLLVMHSDGVSAQWQMAKYPGLRSRGAGVIAGVLYRDHRRIRDDATVLVLRRGVTPVPSPGNPGFAQKPPAAQ